MTPQEFQSWRKKHFKSQLAACRVLGLSRNTLSNYELGYRASTAVKVKIPRIVELACLAIDAGLHELPSRTRDVLLLKDK